MRPQLIIGLVLALAVTAFLFMALNKPAPPPVSPQAASQEIKTSTIYVAAQPIPIGAVIKPEMLTTQPWPEHLVLPGFVRADGGALTIVGEVARAPFQAQEPIINAKLANPSDPNFLAGELPKGMRVITITSNETEGVAGFLFPGDHVDVMLTHEVEIPKVSLDPTQSNQTDKDPVTETLLNNVKVVAVDQRAAGAAAVGTDGKLAIPRSVSLMVSPTDAQRVRLGEKLGTLTLSLRSLADRESADPMTITRTGDISQYRLHGAERSGDEGVRIYRGAPTGKDGGGSSGGASAAAAPAVPAAAQIPAGNGGSQTFN